MGAIMTLNEGEKSSLLLIGLDGRLGQPA